MQSTTALAPFQSYADDLTPVPPPGRVKGLNVHALTLLQLTAAPQRAQRALQLASYATRRLPSGAGRPRAYTVLNLVKSYRLFFNKVS